MPLVWAAVPSESLSPITLHSYNHFKLQLIATMDELWVLGATTQFVDKHLS